MGLDMSLYAIDKDAADKIEAITDARERADVFFRASRDEVAYWRKANQVHAWFVEEVQKGVDECIPTRVHPEQLADLHDRCKQVIADPDKGPELLPTRVGFFFGSTGYDDYYLQQLEDTVERLERLLATPEHRGRVIYYWSSW